jgi:double-strand break repair protein MRE11
LDDQLYHIHTTSTTQDLVVWGHEHECVIELSESVVGTFRVSQPGSSVATSLVAGEAVCKKVGLLDVKGTNFRLIPIPLTQVRSFVMGTVDLAKVPKLDPDDPKVDTKVSKVLEDKVRVLILNAQEKREELVSAAKEAGNVLANHLLGGVEGEEGGNSTTPIFPLKHTLNKVEEVLVRLKVDHTGFSVMNNQRFGAKFIGQVANPVSKNNRFGRSWWWLFWSPVHLFSNT